MFLFLHTFLFVAKAFFASPPLQRHKGAKFFNILNISSFCVFASLWQKFYLLSKAEDAPPAENSGVEVFTFLPFRTDNA